MKRILLASLFLFACGDEAASLFSTDAEDSGLDTTSDVRAIDADEADANEESDGDILVDSSGTDFGLADVELELECLELVATGSDIGDVPTDVTLLDCDGNEHSLRELCAEQAAWVFVYTGWCPPCQVNAGIANEFAAEFASDGFATYFVVSETQTFDEPDADYCSGIRDRFGLTMPVLFDPDQAMPAAAGMPHFDIDIVLGADNELLFAKQHASREEVREVILSRLPQ
ncbi:MAG: peroxiredoxin [Bradymonadia bacterium]|jgi:peroxiredoxin